MPRSKCHCKSCGDAFLWMTTENGKMMPVDYKPELENIEKWDPKTMINHWATCSGAAQFKKDKARGHGKTKETTTS
jgi:hypothetical protein